MLGLILNTFFLNLEIYTIIQINHFISLWKVNYAHHILCDHKLNLLSGYWRKYAIRNHRISLCMWEVNEFRRIRLKSLVSLAITLQPNHNNLPKRFNMTVKTKGLRRKKGCSSHLKVSGWWRFMKFPHPEEWLLTYLTSQSQNCSHLEWL